MAVKRSTGDIDASSPWLFSCPEQASLPILLTDCSGSSPLDWQRAHDL